MVTSDLQRLGRPGIFMGSPTVTNPTGSIHAGALEFGPDAVSQVFWPEETRSPIFACREWPIHSVGQTIFWGDYLFVTTRED